MEDTSFFAAIGAGLASFFSPCVLPLIPVYLASLVSVDILEAEKAEKARWSIFLHSLSFTSGFVLVFSAMGFIAGTAGIFINPNSPAVQTIVGIIIVLLGAFLILSRIFPALNYEKRLHIKTGRKSSYIRSFFTGSVFTLAWTPCISPILGSILALATNSETVAQGTFLLFIYSISFGVPFLIVGAFFDRVLPLIKKISKYSIIVNTLAGVLLIMVGIFVLTGNISTLMPGA